MAKDKAVQKKDKKSPQMNKTSKAPVKKEVKKEVKEEKPVVETPVETPVVETPVDNTVVETEEKKDPVCDSIQNLINKFDMMEKESKASKNELRKVLKLYQKKTSKAKKRKADPNRTPSGFAKPSLISDELCKFLKKPLGSKMARTDVTKEVNVYIKQHNLQNPENKKQIVPDKILVDLLKISKSEVLTYFSLQKFLKSHFPKQDTTVTA